MVSDQKWTFPNDDSERFWTKAGDVSSLIWAMGRSGWCGIHTVDGENWTVKKIKSGPFTLLIYLILLDRPLLPMTSTTYILSHRSLWEKTSQFKLSIVYKIQYMVWYREKIIWKNIVWALRKNIGNVELESRQFYFKWLKWVS